MTFTLKTPDYDIEVKDDEEVLLVENEMNAAYLADDRGLILSKPDLTDPDRYQIAFDHDLRVYGTYEQVWALMAQLDSMEVKFDR